MEVDDNSGEAIAGAAAVSISVRRNSTKAAIKVLTRFGILLVTLLVFSQCGGQSNRFEFHSTTFAGDILLDTETGELVFRPTSEYPADAGLSMTYPSTGQTIYENYSYETGHMIYASVSPDGLLYPDRPVEPWPPRAGDGGVTSEGGGRLVLRHMTCRRCDGRGTREVDGVLVDCETCSNGMVDEWVTE